MKKTLGTACHGEPVHSMEVRGRCMREGRPRIIEVNETEVLEALAEPLKAIVNAVKGALETIPPEISADIYDQGLVLTGGGALLRRLDQRLREETGVPVQVAEDPLTSVVQGRRPDARRRRPAAPRGLGRLAAAAAPPPALAGPTLAGAR